MPQHSLLRANALHLPTLPLEQFLELAAVVGRGQSFDTGITTPRAFSCLAAAHDFLFLEQGAFEAWSSEGKAWGAIGIETTAGRRWVGSGGDVFEEHAAVARAAQEALGSGAGLAHAAGSPRQVHQTLGLGFPMGNLEQLGQTLGADSGLGLHFCFAIAPGEVDPEALAEELWNFSCHPFVAKGIVRDMLLHGERAATVMPHLLDKLPRIQSCFAALGVQVRRTWARPSKGHKDVPPTEPSPPSPMFMDGDRDRPMRKAGP